MDASFYVSQLTNKLSHIALQLSNKMKLSDFVLTNKISD